MCAAVGYYLSYYNVPIFPHGCTSPDLHDKSQFTTLIRVNSAFGKMGKAFGELYTFFNWTTTVMLTSEEVFTCWTGARIVDAYFRQINVKVAEWIKSYSTFLPDDIIDEYLERVKERGRSIYFQFIIHNV